ncbi:MAG: glycoside-pentoside-hexuronide (GPH):cation symporter [Christensenella sp.]|nr:glycoside-pentoside-hexuronide (GPH):cation symporter [Christensenella sp.]
MIKLNEIPILHKFLGTDPSKPETVQPKEALSYSFAGFGQNIICQLVTTFFMVYLTDVAKISPIWLAYMFLFARLFDAFNDPIMGTIVDRTKSKWGKMRPYLLYTPIPIGIFTILLFTAGLFAGFSDVAKFVYATVVYLCWGIAYTIVDVPYWGLSSSMTKDTAQRNTLLTVARLICTIGSGLVSVAIPIVTNITGPSAIAYLIIGIVCVVIAIPTFWVGFKFTKERFYDDESKKESLGESIKLLFKNTPLLLLILVGVLGGLRTIYMTTSIYYANYNLMNLNLASVIFLLVVPGGLVATLLTPVLSNKFGKKNLFIYSHLIGGILLVLLYFIGMKSNGTSTLSQIAFYIIVIIAGIPSGFSNILTYSMIADSIDYLEDKTGKRAEGICFSMQTLISKIGMALTAFVTLMVLGVFGYDQSFLSIFQEGVKEGILVMGQDGVIQAQGAGAADFIAKITASNFEGIKTFADFQKNFSDVCSGNWLATTLLCGISMFACVIPLFFYKFDEKEQANAVVRIAARKAGLEVAKNATKEEVYALAAEKGIEIKLVTEESVIEDTPVASVEAEAPVEDKVQDSENIEVENKEENSETKE